MVKEDNDVDKRTDSETTTRVDELNDVRAQLRVAQERLATYQTFDRDIAENVRRSSELMLEAMQVRERVDADAVRLAEAARAEMDNNLSKLRDDLNSIQSQTSAALKRVDALRVTLAGGSLIRASDDEPNAEVTVEALSSIEEEGVSVEAESTSLATAHASDEPDDDEPEFVPVQIDLIASGLTRTATALALQSHLRALPSVAEVDAREFSSGILRLSLLLIGPLSDEDLHGWEDAARIEISRHPGGAIEVRITE